MALAFSTEDEQLIAKIEAEIASKKKAEIDATALEKQLADIKKKQKTPKFNSKGKTVAKEEVKAKVKVKSTRGKPPTKKVAAKKPEAKKPTTKKVAAKKPEAKKPTTKKVAAKKPTVKKKAPSKLTTSLKSLRNKPETPKATKALTRSLKDGRTKPKPKPKVATKKLKTSLRKGARSKPVTPTSVKGKLLQSIKDSRVKPSVVKATKVEAKKPTVKTLSAESKPSTNAKIRRKKVNASRGKPPTKTKVDVRRTGGPKFGTGNKTATAKTATPKRKIIKGSSTVGPAGERIGGSTKTVIKGSKASTLASKLSTFAKFGRVLSPLLAAVTVEKLAASADAPPKGGKLFSGFKEIETKKPAATTSSFGTAFRTARKAGKSKFAWNGKSYSTATKDDVKKSGSKDLRGHLNAKTGKKATSFGTAFKAAKEEGKKTFKFNGKSYSTKTK